VAAGREENAKFDGLFARYWLKIMY